MEVAHIHVSGTQAHPGRVQPITAGIVGAVVRMSYTDDPWDGLIRNVVFRHEGKSVVILNAGKTVQLPAELVAEPSREPVYVGVCGVDANDTVLIPTLWAKIGPVCPSPSLSGEPAADPGLPIWAQLQQADARIEQKADNAKAAADNANVTAQAAAAAAAAAQQTADGAIQAPAVAEVGQTIAVNEVDENGKPISWRAVDFSSGGAVSGDNDWSVLTEFIYNKNTELTVDSFTAANKHLHFTAAHGLAVGDYLLIHNTNSLRTSTVGYTVVTEVVDAQTVICDSITSTWDITGVQYKVEKSGGRVLFDYTGLITKPYARLRISGRTIFLDNANWSFSTYWWAYGHDLLLGEVSDRISAAYSVVWIHPAMWCGRKIVYWDSYNHNGDLVTGSPETSPVAYTSNYSPVPNKWVATPQLVYNGMKIILEEADTWELP